VRYVSLEDPLVVVGCEFYGQSCDKVSKTSASPQSLRRGTELIVLCSRI